jgi:hypothetical protein
MSRTAMSCDVAGATLACARADRTASPIPPFRPVIFHGDEPTACGGNLLGELFSVDGFDAIKVDHPHGCAFCLQLISGL